MSTSAMSAWYSRLSPSQRELLKTREGRIAVCKYDFETFCMVYFRHLMADKSTGGEVSWSEFHRAMLSRANWYTTDPGIGKGREAWAAPRGSGKSTILKMLMIWLGAYKHQKLIVVLSATTTQAELHLANIRREFDENDLLREDFPGLVNAAVRKQQALKMADNKSLIMQQNGFVVTARGIESKLEGLNINGRPDFIILDDIEASEENTTKGGVDSLLNRIQSDIYPLNINAHIVWIGTTTRPGGLVEQLVHKSLGMMHSEWVDDDGWKVNYFPALVTGDDGIQRSMWPERWDIEWLTSQLHRRDFKKNFMCLPASEDSPYWSEENIQYSTPEDITHVVLSIDPAITSKDTSDQTGIAVLGWSNTQKKIWVLHAEGVRMKPEELRTHVLQLLTRYPEIGRIYIETNQGGDFVTTIFHDMPIKLDTVHQNVKKEIRAGEVLTHYERGRVFHARKLIEAENQMMRFPNDAHDDIVDAIGSGVLYLARTFTRPTAKAGVHVTSYV